MEDSAAKYSKNEEANDPVSSPPAVELEGISPVYRDNSASKPEQDTGTSIPLTSLKHEDSRLEKQHPDKPLPGKSDEKRRTQKLLVISIVILFVLCFLLIIAVAILGSRIHNLNKELQTTSAQTGPPGTDGKDGNDGVSGPQGVAGTDGYNGTRGDTGPIGPQGGDGADGLNGTQGVMGVAGPKGAVGPLGLQGAAGSIGETGAKGENGSQGIPGPEGLQGPQGPPGADGATGPQGARGASGARGFRGFSGLPGTDGDDGRDALGGSIYTRWGRTTCGVQSELIYKGFAAGSSHDQPGGGGNYQCLPLIPEYASFSGNSSFSYIAGVEYETFGSTLFPGDTVNQNVPCARCYTVNRPGVMMLPAQRSCPANWNKEYEGYLMSGLTAHTQSSTFECVDADPEYIAGSSADTNGALLFFVLPICTGSGNIAHCPPYEANKELTCVVCSR